MAKKILVVEDDAVLANALQISLQGAGYETVQCGEGGTAESVIREVMPDLILLDLLLPVKNGFEILRVISKDETLKRIPVVILTNFEQETSVEEGLKLGAKDCIVKANIDIKDVPLIVEKNLPK